MSKYDFNFDLYEDSTLAWIAQKIKVETNILEFGAANGRLTRFLKKEKLCCVDIVEIDEESGSEAALYAEFSWVGKERGDIEKYHWLNTSKKYDYIIFADVLEHLLNPQHVLECCKSVLKDNGEVLVSVPNISHNSIIIELMNDRFNYTPIGLLDNTHLRFFTRQSFIQMVEKIGLVIVDERAKYIRVGENEIKNTYGDVSKEIFKVLANRDNGEVYQYMFSLARSDEYLGGKCSRKVNFNKTFYYSAKAQYDQDGVFDYKKEIDKYVNPSYGYLETKIDILQGSHKCLLQFLNCNCITGKPIVKIRSLSETWREVENYINNVDIQNGGYYFYQKMPELVIELQETDCELEISMPIYAYDIEGTIFDVYVQLLNNQNQKIIDLEYQNQNLNNQIEKMENQYQNKEMELKHSSLQYEEIVKQKDMKFQESVNIYENMIKKKDNEFKQSIDIYENVIQQKENEYQENISLYKKEIENLKTEVELLKKRPKWKVF